MATIRNKKSSTQTRTRNLAQCNWTRRKAICLVERNAVWTSLTSTSISITWGKLHRVNVIEWGMDKSSLRQRRVMFTTSDTLTRAVSEAISKHINRSLYIGLYILKRALCLIICRTLLLLVVGDKLKFFESPSVIL